MHPELKEAVLHGTQEYPFALYRVRGGGHGRSTPPHWHQETELVYVEAGTLHLTIGEESFTGNAGGLFLVNGGQIHSMTFDRSETQYLTILFPISSLQFLNLDGSRNFLLPLSEHKTGFVPVLTGTQVYDGVREDIFRLVELHIRKPTAYQLGVKACLLDIVCRLYAGEMTVKTARKPEDATCREILTYLQDHFSTEVSLGAAAQRFHMSEKYFSRFFKRTFGLTFVDYVNHLRMERAAELLTTTDLPVTEIGLECGFSSASYFTKRFKARMGLTPRAYRQNRGQG